MWSLDTSVSRVVISFTILGITFYIGIVVSSCEWPSQKTASTVPHRITESPAEPAVEANREHKEKSWDPNSRQRRAHNRPNDAVGDLLGIRTVGIAVAQNRVPDAQGLVRREEFRAISIDGADRIVACRANSVDKKVEDDLLSASRLLRETDVTKSILLDKRGVVTEPTSDQKSVGERSGRIRPVSDDNDRVLQRTVPWTGESFDSTNGPSVAEMTGLRELNAD